jgi:flagellar biosynthesis protein FlhB
MADGALRTEPATPARRAAARRAGVVAVSPEVAPVAVLATLVVAAGVGGPLVVARGGAVLTDWLAAAGPIAAHDGALAPLVGRTAHTLAVGLGPLFLLVTLAGAAAIVAQVGWQPRPALVLPDPRRLAARFATREGGVRLVRAVLKVGIVAAVAWLVLARLGPRAAGASELPVGELLGLAGTSVRTLGVALVAALAGFGAADWAWARWRRERRLRTTRAELRRETREREGDPHLRARFRRLQRERATRRMPTRVAGADVVLARAGAFAVAVRYRPDEADAPRVVAKGAGAAATAIVASARAAGVTVVERATLADALFRTVPLDAAVPPSRYRHVADVLAQVRVQAGARS